jgi:hypothetical protein
LPNAELLYPVVFLESALKPKLILSSVVEAVINVVLLRRTSVVVPTTVFHFWRLPKYAIPVVVAPPEIVSPPVAVPLPTVLDAYASKPFVITGVCVSWYATDVVECARPSDEKKSADVVENALPVFCERKYDAEVVENERPAEV